MPGSTENTVGEGSVASDEPAERGQLVGRQPDAVSESMPEVLEVAGGIDDRAGGRVDLPWSRPGVRRRAPPRGRPCAARWAAETTS